MKIWPLFAVLLLVACADSERSPLVSGGGGGPDANLCTDEDGDGFGDGCAHGGDCNDEDPAIHKGCLTCSRPAEGCLCESSSKPVSCYLDPSFDNAGAVMCHEGTRYCRNGSWSGCESIFTYPKPAATTPSQAVITSDAGLEKCSDCRPNCYIVRDNLNPIDGGLGGSGNNTTIGDGGSLTLGTYLSDAGTDASATWDASACVAGSAPDKDCDGILDQYDPYPTMKPFATANPSIFLDVAPGGTATGAIDLKFNLSSVDVYFLVDQTTTMTGERTNLINTLTSGDYVNDSTYNCADYDFDHLPNNELKAKGITGAIRCYIRDANFGVGFFREIPFSHYADLTETAYGNLQDITSDVTKALTAVNKLSINGNNDYDEDAMPALYSAITGNGMYFGTDRKSIPTRSGCPGSTWGYPCFRSDAIPIVILFTDAATHAGPSPLTRSYGSSYLTVSSTNTAASVTMVSGNESPTSGVIDAADLTNSYVSFQGDTTGMADNASGKFQCSSGASPDAFYKFSLSGTKSVTITTKGSDIDTVLGVWRGLPTAATATSTMPSGNDVAGTAFGFGNITNSYLQASGSTSSLDSDYLAADLGCSAYAGSKDAAFTFTVGPAATKVALDTSGSTIGTSLSLFSTTPTAPTYDPATVNTNDTYAVGSVKDIGTIDGLMKAFHGSTSSLAANYTNAQLGCSTDSTAPDAVYQFTVGGTANRRVRISTEGSTWSTMTPALRPVLNLTNNGASFSSPLTYTNNDQESNNPSTIALDGQAYTISTDTSSTSYSANYGTTTYDPVGGGCLARGNDAIYKFSLAAQKTVKIETSNAAFNTTLGLFRSSITPANQVSASGTAEYDTLASAYTGSITTAKHVVSSSTTSGMTPDYTAANVQVQSPATNCNAADASPDAIYKMTFTGATKLHLETSAASFDTVVSLHSSLPDLVTPTSINSGDVVSGSSLPATGKGSLAYSIPDPTGKVQQFSNSTYISSSSSYYSNVQIQNGQTGASACAANDLAPDAVFSFTVPTGGGTYAIDTIGSTGMDTVLGIFKSANVATFPAGYSTPTDLTNTGDRYDSSVVNLGDMANSWKSWKGDYSGLGDHTGGSGPSDMPSTCGGNDKGRDVWLKFTAGSAAANHILRIDTYGSTYNSALGLYTAPSSGNPVYVSCSPNLADPNEELKVTVPSGGGSWFILLKGRANNVGGAYKLTIRDLNAVTTPVTGAMEACNDDGGGGTDSRISTVTLAAGTHYAVVKGKDATSSGSFKLRIKDLTWANGTKFALACNDNASSSTTLSSLDYDIPGAGTYYAVVKGKSSSSSGYGTYTLTMQDNDGVTGFITCNDDAAVGVKTSSLTQTLPAGTYYAVVKGNTNDTIRTGAFRLNIGDTAAAAMTVLACDYGGGSGNGSDGSALIDTDLAPGTYRLFVKGTTANPAGNYNVQVRDVTGVPLGSNRLNCDYQSGSGSKSYMETTLNPGTYTAVLKGDNASGNYKLSVRDADHVNGELSAYCNDSTGTDSITQSLTAGTYYVGVKGKTSTDVGQYQVHFGGGSLTSTTYVPKTYTDVVAAMKAKKARVISILSCSDDPNSSVQADCVNARTQYESLATETDSLDKLLKPLVLDIHSDGSGLSKTVVDAVNSLAHYLEMDVGVRVVFSPDANPGFGLVVKAVDVTGDGCKPPVNDVHQDCTPGATPRFEISFSNPLATPVPLNPSDPKGGYNFRAELIGNDQFIVDQIPIYVVPKAVVNVPVPTVYSTGSYSQNLGGSACAGKTDLPDWNELTWNATIPNGTSVSFSACGAGTAAALATCTAKPICTITGGAGCAAGAPCPTGSLCSAGGNCWKITGATCSDNTQCTSGATCMTGTCVWANQPIDVGELLGEHNYQPNLRVQIGLTANTALNVGPTVHDWQLNYLCKSSL